MLAFLAPRAIPGVEAVDLDAGVYRRTIDARRRRRRGDRGRERRRRTQALLLRAHLPDVRRARAPRRAGPPAVRPRRRPRRRSTAPRPRSRAAAARARATAGCGCRARSTRSSSASARSSASRCRSPGRPRLAGRLVAALRHAGPGHRARSGLTHSSRPRRRCGDAPLDDIGITTTRADAIRAFAGARPCPLDGSLEPRRPRPRAAAPPGIGPWTAHYIAMRGAGERDAFPASDLASASARRVAGRRARRGGWRPVARPTRAMHLWCAARASVPAQTRQTA